MLVRLGLRKPSRADDARAVHERLQAAHGDDLRELAEEILAKKLALAAAYGEVSSCATCAKGKPGERGAYAGGDCCSGGAATVFTDDEVAALARSGTRQRDLVPAKGPATNPGCAFRGPTGCSLAVAHRPTICVRYACQALQRELHRKGRHDVEGLAHELGATLQRFAALRAEGEAQAERDAILESLGFTNLH